MTNNQLECLKILNNGIKRREEIPLNDYEIYCFLSDEGYAHYMTGREDNYQFNYFQISEKGKAFLSDHQHSTLSFLINIATFAVALLTLIVSCSS